MTEYLKIVPLPSWWQKLELNDWSIYELFKELLSWNLESKLITPRYITCTYFGAIVTIFNFIFSVCFLCIKIFYPWAGPQSGPCHLFFYLLNGPKLSNFVLTVSSRQTYLPLLYLLCEVRHSKTTYPILSSSLGPGLWCVVSTPGAIVGLTRGLQLG